MPGPLPLGEIASRLGGRVVGDAGVQIDQVGSLEHAGPRQIASSGQADPTKRAAELISGTRST